MINIINFNAIIYWVLEHYNLIYNNRIFLYRNDDFAIKTNYSAQRIAQRTKQTCIQWRIYRRFIRFDMQALA